MNVTQDLSILTLVLEASAVVQAVMVLLASVSFMSWYYIFRKAFAVKDSRKLTERFEREFWSGADLNALFKRTQADRLHAGPQAANVGEACRRGGAAAPADGADATGVTPAAGCRRVPPRSTQAHTRVEEVP